MELLEDAHPVLLGYARPRVHHANCEVAVGCRRADTHFPGIGELDGVPDQIKQDLRQALFVAEADRQGLGNIGLEGKLLGFGQ